MNAGLIKELSEPVEMGKGLLAEEIGELRCILEELLHCLVL